MDVRNPRSGEIDYRFVPTEESQIIATCARARKGQKAWEALAVPGRAAVLQQWKQRLIASREDLLQALSRDTGRLRESVREVDNLGKWIDRWTTAAEDVLSGESRTTSHAAITSIDDYSAYPLVGIISPWNFPLSLSLMDAIPALLAGCAVVVKPSEVTPRFVEPLRKTIEACETLCEVLFYVLGDGAVGEALIDQVDMVCFTGSTATGRKVSEQAARRFIPVFTELGGKDPAIVLESADIERASTAILTGSVLGVGHQCYSIERIYVADSIHDVFLASLVKKAKRLHLVYPEITDGEIGPIIYDQQASIIARHLDDALKRGGRCHTGGKIEQHGGGLWCEPTVLTEVDHSMLIMQEETFGPIMPVMRFSSVDEAVRLANDTDYGLSAAVFAGTIDEALAVARRIDAGAISVNDAGLAPFFIGAPDVAEKTAFKSSGLGGSRLGIQSIKRFVRKKAILCNTSKDRSPWWYDV